MQDLVGRADHFREDRLRRSSREARRPVKGPRGTGTGTLDPRGSAATGRRVTASDAEAAPPAVVGQVQVQGGHLRVTSDRRAEGPCPPGYVARGHGRSAPASGSCGSDGFRFVPPPGGHEQGHGGRAAGDSGAEHQVEGRAPRGAQLDTTADGGARKGVSVERKPRSGPAREPPRQGRRLARETAQT